MNTCPRPGDILLFRIYNQPGFEGPVLVLSKPKVLWRRRNNDTNSRRPTKFYRLTLMNLVSQEKEIFSEEVERNNLSLITNVLDPS